MARPWLTIDFKGLCAFVTDTKDPEEATRLHVLMLDTDNAAPGEHLCRHDPMVVLRGDTDFVRASKATESASYSFSSLDEEDYGIWLVGRKDLRLDYVAPETKEPLEIGRRFSKVLSFEQINGGDGRVKRESVEAADFPPASSRLTIDHGRVSARRWSDPWGFAPETGTPGDGDWMRFRQVVRWRIFAEPTTGPAHFRLSAVPEDPTAESEEWIQLKPRAHIVISNLCPLSPGGGPAKDVLAYYAFCESPVDPAERVVLHRKPESAAFAGAGYPVRPGVDACPPFSGYLASP